LASAEVWSAGSAADSVHFPPRGSPERNAIMHAMRMAGDLPNSELVIDYLKVRGDWAWMRVHPKSPEEARQYKSESALVHREGAGWKIEDQTCAGAECSDAKELERIEAAFPQAPKGIFEPVPASGSWGR
jgi:hypothetical protein